jgi:chromosome segregation ATPase
MKVLRTYLVFFLSGIFLGSIGSIFAPAEEPLVNAKHTFDVAQQELVKAEETVAQKKLEAQRAQTAEQEVLEKEQTLKAEETKGQDVAKELQQVEAEKAQKEAEAERAQEELQEAQQLEEQQKQNLKNAQTKLTVAEQQANQANQSQAEKIKIAEEIGNVQTMVEALTVSEGNKLESRSVEVRIADYQDVIGKRKALEVMLKQHPVDSPEYKALQPAFVQLQGLEQVTHSKAVESVIDIITKTPDLKMVEEKLNTIKRRF